MQRLFEQVSFDKEKNQFFAVCSDCGKRVYATKLPLIHQRKESATWCLAKYFNRCDICRSWVCDRCFALDEGYGICRSCLKNQCL